MTQALLKRLWPFELDLPPDRLYPPVQKPLARISASLHAVVRLNYMSWIQDITYEDGDTFLAIQREGKVRVQG
jgi:hypothetical protein